MARRNDLWNHRIHEAVPAFSGLSLDDDPGDGNPAVGDVVGTINGYLTYDRASLVDTPQRHEVIVSLRSGTARDAAPAAVGTVDWTPRRLTAFPEAPGQHVRFGNLQQPGDELLAEWILTADASGRITAPQTTVTTAGNRLRLDVLDLASLPHLVATGPVRPGGRLTLTALGAPGAEVWLFAGLQAANLAVPGLVGLVGIADPTLVSSGAISPAGRWDTSWELDEVAFAPLVGATVHFQALVGPNALTNPEAVTLAP